MIEIFGSWASERTTTGTSKRQQIDAARRSLLDLGVIGRRCSQRPRALVILCDTQT